MKLIVALAFALLALVACQPAADSNLSTTVARERLDDDRSTILTPTVQPTAQIQDGPFAGMTPALVTNVVDGDTVDVLVDGTGYRVRYLP